MKRLRIKFTSLLIPLILFSCSQHNSEVEGYYHKIDISNRHVQKSQVEFSSILDNKSLKFIALETTEDCLIGSIEKVLFHDGYYYILDRNMSQMIYKFNKEGEFIQKIGKQGNGPGEYTMPMDFCIGHNNNIVILDNGYYITKFTSEGKHIAQQQLKDFAANGIERIQNGYAFIGGGESDNLVITNKDFSKVDSFFSYQNPNASRLILSPLQHIHENLIIYRRFLDDTIYRIKNNQPVPHVVLSYENSAKPNISTTRKQFKKQLRQAKLIKSYYETEDDVFMMIADKGEPFLLFYHKPTRAKKFFSYFDLVNDVSFDNQTSYVIGSDPKTDRFIFYIQPENIDSGKFKITDVQSETVKSQIREILQKVDKHSNPILLLADIKLNKPQNENK